MTFLALIVAVWLVWINVLTARLFAEDKVRAEEGAWRISEGTLLFYAFIGGSAGAKWAQRRYRHKTRKQPFAASLNTMVGVNLAFMAVLAVLAASPGLRGALAEGGRSLMADLLHDRTQPQQSRMPRRFGPGS